MNNNLENLTKTLHSIQFAINDLKLVLKSDNLLLVELVMPSLKALNEQQTTIKNLIAIITEMEYEEKVSKLENEGLTRSDAQAVVDAEELINSRK